MSNQEPKCSPFCEMYTGGEKRHAKCCPHYPESLTKIYDELKEDVFSLKKANEFNQARAKNALNALKYPSSRNIASAVRELNSALQSQEGGDQ